MPIQSVPMAEKFAGINRAVAPFLLPPSESPDTKNAAPSLDILGLLGARRGRQKRQNRSFNILGVVPFNIPLPGGGHSRIIATTDGTWSPVSVPVPALVSPVGCTASSLNYAGGPSGGGPTGALCYISIVADGVTPGAGVGLAMYKEPVIFGESLGVGRQGASWKPSAGDVQSYNDGAGVILTASPLFNVIEGYISAANYLPSAGWNIELFGGAGSFRAQITPVTDNVVINGSSVAVGESVQVTGTFASAEAFGVGF